MQLQNGCRNLRSYRSEKCIFYSLGFVFAADYHQNLPGLHDASDAHGVGLSRNIVFRLKEALVGINGAFGQVDAVGFAGEGVCRFVEADVAVAAKTEKL